MEPGAIRCTIELLITAEQQAPTGIRGFGMRADEDHNRSIEDEKEENTRADFKISNSIPSEP